MKWPDSVVSVNTVHLLSCCNLIDTYIKVKNRKLTRINNPAKLPMSWHSSDDFPSCFYATTKTKERTVAQQIPISPLRLLCSPLLSCLFSLVARTGCLRPIIKDTLCQKCSDYTTFASISPVYPLEEVPSYFLDFPAPDA